MVLLARCALLFLAIGACAGVRAEVGEDDWRSRIEYTSDNPDYRRLRALAEACKSQMSRIEADFASQRSGLSENALKQMKQARAGAQMEGNMRLFVAFDGAVKAFPEEIGTDVPKLRDLYAATRRARQALDAERGEALLQVVHKFVADLEELERAQRTRGNAAFAGEIGRYRSRVGALAALLRGESGVAEGKGGEEAIVWVGPQADGRVPLPADPGFVYCVVDLAPGPQAARYPVGFLRKEPAGGWTSEYKTSKLVLKRVEAGTCRGGAVGEPFYIGVFEVTQRQYESVMAENPSYHKGALRPVENLCMDTLRGDVGTYNRLKTVDVDPGTFLGKIRRRTGLDFDLPTEIQWEYACRAGTSTEFNNGGSTESDMRKVGRYFFNQRDRKDTFNFAHAEVGQYQPNRWGLYDMHGNAWEWCLDSDLWRNESIARGGNWHAAYELCTSSYVRKTGPDDAGSEVCSFGFRLALPAK